MSRIVGGPLARIMITEYLVYRTLCRMHVYKCISSE